MNNSEEKVIASDEKTITKEAKFKKIAQQRTRTILKTLKLLGNCSNKSHYGYTDEEVKKIFTAIEKELKNTKNKFSETLDDFQEEFTL